MRWVARIVLIVVILIAAVLLWLRTTGPGSDTTLRVAGLTAPVTVERDGYGIATITAANTRDALFALGFLHAEERLFQMELTRRLGAGRLSELFGPGAVPTDKYMRTLGLYRAAEAQYNILSPDARGELDAYVAGVNAWLAQRSVALPPEYYLIRARPEPWRPANSLVWGKLMALQLAGNFRDELLRARILRHIKPEELGILFPPYPKNAPSFTGETDAWLKRLDLDAIYAALPKFVGPTYESNNWVVDGKHTASGKPMLANDPHLSLNAPGVWYLAHLKTPELDVAGVTAPGNPYVVLGHNAHIAWGFTTTTGDVEDLFIEKIDPKDPTHYLTPNGSAAFTTRDETIAVRGGDAVKLMVRETRHGPVISDLAGKYGAATDAGTVLALQTTWLMPDDRSPEALRGINYAKNWSAFRDAMKLFGAPEQNMVVADDAGEIGFIAPARIPIRGKGDGYMPVPGWSGDYDWKGFIPFDDLPQGLNPASGRFVTANQKIVPESLQIFHQPRLGHSEPCRAHQPTARRRQGQETRARRFRRDPGRYAVAGGDGPGPADDCHTAVGSARPARDRAAQGVELPHGSRPGRAADFHRLAAGAWTRPFRQEARRCVSRLLGGAAFGGARHPDGSPRLVCAGQRKAGRLRRRPCRLAPQRARPIIGRVMATISRAGLGAAPISRRSPINSGRTCR